MNHFVYKIGSSIYVNLTNRCTCRCSFCALGKNAPLLVRGFDLKLDHEPSVEEVMLALETPEAEGERIKEAVFCGFGEPTLRLRELKQIAALIRPKGVRVRLNTNGHGNVIHKRNIVPEFQGLIDEARISLNTVNAVEYNKINNPLFKEDIYPAVKEFILECKKVIPIVIASAVALPGLDLHLLKLIAHEELGVPLMVRELDREGEPQQVI